MAEARRRQVDVESILVDQYKVPKAELGLSLSQYYRCPFIEYDERIIPPPDLMRDLKLEYLRRNFWLPLRREDNAVVVLIDNPEDLQHVDSVSQALKNRKIKWAVGLRQDILAYLNITTGEPTSKGAIGHILGELKAEDVPGESAVDSGGEISGGEVDENDSAVIRLANQVIVDA